MPKKTTSVDIEKLELRRTWCLTILEFAKPDLSEDIYQNVLRLFNKAFDERNTRGIRDVIVAAKELVSGASPAEERRINELLLSRCGWTLRDESEEDSKRVTKLLKRKS